MNNEGHVFLFLLIILFIFRFSVAHLFVSITFRPPMFLLTFFSAVKNKVTSFAWSEFLLWWIVWSEAGCTFNGLWNERGCCSSFMFVKSLQFFDSVLQSLLC